MFSQKKRKKNNEVVVIIVITTVLLRLLLCYRVHDVSSKIIIFMMFVKYTALIVYNI